MTRELTLRVTDLEKKAIAFCREKDVPFPIANYLVDFATEATKELEAQIEKMKCCGNCKNEGDYKEPYRYGTGWCNICTRHKVAKGNFDKWEIKEK